MSSLNRITGRSAFLALLKDEGITHLFGNPGTTELPIMHALTDHPDLKFVLALQESLVVAMADGYSRASGELVACNVHVAPGLGNALGSLFNAKFTGTPMILTAGQQEQGHGLMEPLLYDSLVPMAAPLVKWAVEVARLEDLPRIIHRAAKVATTAPTGPVFISLPGDILNEEAGIEMGHSTRVETAMRPTDETLDRMAQRLLEAKNPAIVAGPEIVTSDAFQEIAEFADALGAPAYQQTIPYGSHYPSEHRAYMGALGRDQKQVRKTLEPYDLLVFVGADVLRMSVWDPVDALPQDMPIMQICLNDWELGKNYPTETAVRADVKETLRVLIPTLKKRGGSEHSERAEARLKAIEDRNWSARNAVLREKIAAQADTTPIAGDWLMMQVVDALPDNAMVVNEGLTTAGKLLDLLPYRDRYSYHALASGGIGWAIAASVGISLAQPDRPLVSVIGDGSAMYSVQALWTAAHLKLPITYVIANNKGYRIIKQRLLSFHGNDNFIGMDFEDPEIDFTGLARSLGMNAERITDPAAVRPALDAAIASGGPTLLDVSVERSVG
ncbi:MAG: thiamine pyrophosphate-binding protein [Alphaproteobacteria bacterium]|nr:thiamine pyrophosphate-binding protein [Alphaproteobacteria bacterium]